MRRNRRWHAISSRATGVYVWHPFTQHGTEAEPASSRGPTRRLALRHRRPRDPRPDLVLVDLHPRPLASALNAGAAAQAARFEHVMFAGFTHQPAVDLASALSQLLPGDLARVFFSDDGSTSVEVALKIAYQYWANRGEGRRRVFISFDGGYHGDTLGAMSLGRGSASSTCSAT